MTLNNLVVFELFSSVLDRDPHGSALMVSWITDLEGKKLRMKIEKVKKNQVSKCWMCCIEG
jgi:hypothetical protein